MEQKQEVRLQKSIGFWPMVFMGVIMMVPNAGLVYLPYVYGWAGGFPWIGYTIAVAFIVFSVMSYQRMISAFPESGSAYAYTSAAFSGKVGFLVGWAILLDQTLSVAMSLKFMAIYITPIIPDFPITLGILVLGIIVFICMYLGIKTSVIIELFFGSYCILFILFYLITGTTNFLHGGIDLLNANFYYNSQTASWTGILNVAALSFIMLPFDGMSTFAEEYTGGSKKFGWAIMTAVSIQAFFIISTAIVGSVGFMTMDIPEEAMDTAYIYILAQWIGSEKTNVILSIGQIATLASLIAEASAGCRVLYCMGRDGVLPRKFFAYLHPKYKTPVLSAAFLMIVIIVCSIIVDVDLGGQLVSFGMCVAVIMTNLSCFKYFWIIKKDHRLFRHLIFPLFSAIGIFYVLSHQGKLCLIVGISWLCLGILYEIIKYKTDANFRNCINEGRIEC